MTIPIAKNYIYVDGFEEDIEIRIYSLNRHSYMTPNSQGAVTLVCDDGVRRCKTVRQWALLCEREGEK